MHIVASAVVQLGTVATRQQLIARGFSGFDITVAVRTGEIFRARQGRYIVAATPPALRTAARVGGLLAGVSAARTYGLWSGFDTRVHLSVGRNSARLRTNVPPSFGSHEHLTSDRSDQQVVLHWLEDGAVKERGLECWRVSLERCLTQVVAWADHETALACLETAIAKYGISGEELSAMFADASIRSRLVANTARPGCDSGIESIVWRRLGLAGIEVDRQVYVAGIGRLDMVIRGTRVVIETDGRTYHADPIAFEEDRRRDAELVSRGYTVIRLSYKQVIANWAWCERMIRTALAHS